MTNRITQLFYVFVFLFAANIAAALPPPPPESNNNPAPIDMGLTLLGAAGITIASKTLLKKKA